MSIRQLDAVLRWSASKGSARLVAIALADVANDDGLVTAYKRSHAVLAAKANIDPKTVPRAIDALVALGEVDLLDEAGNPLPVTIDDDGTRKVDRSAGSGSGRRSTDYRLTIQPPQPAGSPDADPPPAPCGDSPRGARGQTPPDAGSIIPSPPSSPVPAPLSLEEADAPAADPFDEFWDLYPRDRRTGKADARRAWDRAVKRAAPAVILAGLRRYVDETSDRRPDERRFIKTPAPWLNDDRWEDEPGANRRGGNTRPGATPTAARQSGRVSPGEL